MWIFWSVKNELKRVPGGKKIPLNCQKCHQKATFYECKVDEGLAAYAVIDLWKRTKRVMQCGECLAVCDYYDVFPLEKALAEKQAAEQKVKEAEAAADKQRAQHELKYQESLKQQKLIEQKRLQESADIDDELAKLKRKHGKL